MAGAPGVSSGTGAAFLYYGPYFVRHPVNVSDICGDQNATFTAYGILTNFYQWYGGRKGTEYDQLSDNGEYVGSITPELTVVGTGNKNGYFYCCQITNYGRSKMSDTALLEYTETAPDVELTTTDTTIYLDQNGKAPLIKSAFIKSITDPCSILDTTFRIGLNDITEFNCSMLHDTILTIRVEDVSHNVTFKQVIIHILDTISPELTVYEDFVILNDDGMGQLNRDNVVGSATDNCHVVDTTVGPTNFFCWNIGPNTVTVSIADQSQNVTTNTTTVTVMDETWPDFSVVDTLDVYLDENGTYIIDLDEVISNVTENCGIKDTIFQDTVHCLSPGPHDWEISLVDNSDHKTTKTFVVNVIDTFPTIVTTKTPSYSVPMSGVINLNPYDFIK
jgi:hypothetical protein